MKNSKNFIFFNEILVNSFMKKFQIFFKTLCCKNLSKIKRKIIFDKINVYKIKNIFFKFNLEILAKIPFFFPWEKKNGRCSVA